MKWASTVALNNELDDAIADAGERIRMQLDGDTADLAIAFVSVHHEHEFERVPALVRGALGGGLLIGCSGGGVIGGGNEIESRPAVSLTAAVLPGVDLSPFHLRADELPSADSSPRAWEEALGVTVENSPHFLLLPEPFSFDAEMLLRGLDDVFPHGSKLGGVASGGERPGANALYLGAATYRSGMVGLALSGNIEVDTVVAQGCRPIGDPMFVTSCEGSKLLGVDGRPPLDVLKELYGSLGDRDREIFRTALFLGVVMDDDRDSYRQGDFLIRNVVGADEETGALSLGATLREKLVVQFHLRDKQTSSDDIEELLSRYAVNSGRVPAGSLLFSCLGRGAHLYGRPDHDSDTFKRYLGDVPLGGFFCNGEIGEVHGRTFLHGYTSSFGLFRSLPSS